MWLGNAGAGKMVTLNARTAASDSVTIARLTLGRSNAGRVTTLSETIVSKLIAWRAIASMSSAPLICKRI
jgi:hypothetical protein